MTKEEILELKRAIGKQVAKSMADLVGEPMSEVVKRNVIAHLKGILKDASMKYQQPIIELLDFEVKLDGTTLHMQLTNKPGLTDEEYRRVHAFLTGQEFW